MDFTKDLNESQQQAVLNTEGPSLILAGAGSGKTRVLTYRIARLLELGVPAYNILALTFTNKAAREMGNRIEALIESDVAQNLWMGTFHSVFLRILKVEHEAIGFPTDFTIYDTQDSKNLIKSIIKEMGLDDKKYKANAVLSRISLAKNNLVTATAYANSSKILSEDASSQRPHISEIYNNYTRRCKQSGAMDFDDILLQTNILLRDKPEIANKYASKFKYILVDEYQDTNYSQYLIIKKLAEKYHNICVVGDDAQSIYSFRGARIENILNFKNDYPNCSVFKLEQNYRSTPTIVNAANCVIAKNKQQIHKNTWSDNEDGDKIRVIRAMSDREESSIIASEIFRLSGTYHQPLSDFAILYRTNAQSRVLEESLRKRNIPYVIYGGLSFYQRKEIKDILAYVRLSINHKDEEALKRIINYPRRSIGDTTIDKLKSIAIDNSVCIWDVICQLEKIPGEFASSTIKKLESFKDLITLFTDLITDKDAYSAVSEMVLKSGIKADLQADDTPEGVSRKENIQELLNGIKEFCISAEKNGSDNKVPTFMEGVSLLTDQDKDNGENDRVRLMTIHSAKGLEFNTIFISGLEEDLFPASQCMEQSPSAIEEERRLFYVALTRAERRAYLTYSISRFRNGNIVSSSESRFIREIDSKFLDGFINQRPVVTPERRLFTSHISSGVSRETSPRRIMPGVSNIRTTNLQQINNDEIKEGMLVYHGTFGQGRVMSLDTSAGEKRAKIQFEGGAIRILMLRYAKLFYPEKK